MRKITHGLYWLTVCLSVLILSTSAQNKFSTAPSAVKSAKSSGSQVQPYSGVINVGVNETITSLTRADGLFARLNAGVLSGNLIVNITSDLRSETGAVALNHQNEVGSGGYTILIRPSGGSRLVEGQGGQGAFNALLTFDGADRVTIDGTLYGGKGLTIRNTGWFGGAAILIAGDLTGTSGTVANNNTIKSCVVESTGEFLGSGVITVVDSETGSSTNNSIVGNTVRGWEPGPAYEGPPLKGTRVLVAVAGGSNTLIANNDLSRFGKNFGVYGVAASGERNLVISGNTISGNSQYPGPLTAISVAGGSGGSNLIIRNVIRDLYTHEFRGIELLQNSGFTHVFANRIYRINDVCGESMCNNAAFSGIVIRGDEPESMVTVSNNAIAYRPLLSNQWTTVGVVDERAAGRLELLHNSILLGGTAAQWNSWGFRRGPNSAVDAYLFGNIFFSDRTGGGSSFAVGDQSNGAGSWTSDHNLYVGAGETPQNYFDMGSDYLGTPVDFNIWKGKTSRDANSITGQAGTGMFTAENLFISAEDLHLTNLAANPAIDAGLVLSGQGVDLDGEVRPFGSAPDIGADEAGAELAPSQRLDGRVTTAGGRGVSRARITVSGGSLTEPVTLLTSSFGYFTYSGLNSDEVYLITVEDKRCLFAGPMRILSFPHSDATLNFIAEP